jgi:hypothetical protein
MWRIGNVNFIILPVLFLDIWNGCWAVWLPQLAVCWWAVVPEPGQYNCRWTVIMSFFDVLFLFFWMVLGGGGVTGKKTGFCQGDEG